MSKIIGTGFKIMILDDPYADPLTADEKDWRDIGAVEPPRFGGKWPSDIAVPPPPMRGRPREVPTGQDEGEHCFRQHDGRLCQGVIEYLPDAIRGSCGCSTSPMPPCSYCTSAMPECPICGWRMEE